jgi:signal transduction histidine kinase/ligand-binding sensor domain-containing protein
MTRNEHRAISPAAPRRGWRKFLIGIALLIVTFSRGHAESLPVTTFTSADGLGSSFVDYLYRDSRGFMWFCTRDGLSRFDGSRFVTYRVGDGKDSSPGIESIYESRNGTYYISTTIGTYRIDPNVATKPNSANPQLIGTLLTAGRGTFFEDSRGDLWITSGRVARLKEVDGKAEFENVDLKLPVDYKSALIVASIVETPDGSIWFATSWGVVRQLRSGRTVFYPDEAQITSGNSAMLVDKTGRVWMTRMNRVLVIKPEPATAFEGSGETVVRSFQPTATAELKQEEKVSLSEDDGSVTEIVSKEITTFSDGTYAKYLAETKDGDIWISADSNLLQISQGVFHLHSSGEGLPNVMARMAEDSAGNLWIGAQAGLARLDRSGLVTYGVADGLLSSRVFSISESEQGDLFVGGGGFYLGKFDGHRFQSVRPELPRTADFLWTSRLVSRSSDGDWWLLTGQKLYRFKGVDDFRQLNGEQPLKIYGEQDGLASDHIYQLFEDSRGDIWVSTRATGGIGTGLARLPKGGERFQLFSEADGFPRAHSFSSAAEDRNGNLWFGFYEGGLARFDGTRFTFYDADSGLPPGILTDLHVDEKGRLWISSAVAGLYRLDDPSNQSPSFLHFSTADGLSSDNIRTITEDRMGRLYLGTARGVDRFSPDTGRVKHYSVSDGLAADFVVDSHCDSNGDLWFATNNGLSHLTPLPDEEAAPPQVFIGSIRVSGVEQPIAELGVVDYDKGEVTYTESNLQIDVFGLDFRAGNTLKFQYKVEGSDTDWSEPSEARTLSLVNLSPASYKFLIRAINSEGAVSAVPATISITILPPLWERRWFLTIVVALLAIALFLFYQYRLAHLRRVNAALSEAKSAEERLRISREERLAELEEIRIRIATDLHDDIGASLTQITVLSEVAQTQAGKGNGGPPESLQKISEVSNELMGTMSDIVWSINPTKDHLNDLTQRMRRFAADLLSSKSIAFDFRWPDEKGGLALNSNVRREVFLIFKEAVNNIVKHAGAKNVSIRIEIEAPYLSLIIRDDGVGITQRDDPDGSGGNGLLSMERRARELSGDLTITSGSGKGTIIHLRLPLDRLHSTYV